MLVTSPRYSECSEYTNRSTEFAYATIPSVHPQCADGLVHLKPWAAAALSEWGHYERHINNEKSLRETQTLRAACAGAVRPPSLYDTECRADSSFLFKSYLGVKNFEIGSRVPGHAHLGVGLTSICRRGPPSICVPSLKRIAQFIQKL